MKICTGAAIAALSGFMAAAELCADDVSCQHDLATRFAPEFRLDKTSVELKRCLPGHPATCQYLEKVASMDETILLYHALPVASGSIPELLNFVRTLLHFRTCFTLVQATVYEKRKAGYTDDICETDKSKLETVPIFYYYEAGVSWMQNIPHPPFSCCAPDSHCHNMSLHVTTLPIPNGMEEKYNRKESVRTILHSKEKPSARTRYINVFPSLKITFPKLKKATRQLCIPFNEPLRELYWYEQKVCIFTYIYICQNTFSKSKAPAVRAKNM